MASITAGALLIARGVQKKGWGGTALALAGVAIRAPGPSGYGYRKEGRTSEVNGRNTSVRHRTGTRIEEAVTINRPREEVYRFTRDLGNIAEFAESIHSMHTADNGDRSHWVAQGAGKRPVELDAQIIDEKENERVAWRSLEGSDVANAGTILFRDAAGGRGTEVHVEILYAPPGGSVGAFVSKLSGEDPAAQIRNDLRRLKARLEAGVLAEIDGQPAGCPSSARTENSARQRHQKTDQVAKASEASFPASDAPAFNH